jgi:hypothetical protein
LADGSPNASGTSHTLDRFIHRQHFAVARVMSCQAGFDLGIPCFFDAFFLFAVQALNELFDELSAVSLGERARSFEDGFWASTERRLDG